MNSEIIQSLVNDYALELGTLHSNLVIERANNKALQTQLDKVKQELKELKGKILTSKTLLRRTDFIKIAEKKLAADAAIEVAKTQLMAEAIKEQKKFCIEKGVDPDLVNIINAERRAKKNE